MIDLADFEEEHAAALEAAREYRRRWRKGLPYDRWADGTAGAVQVARGIEAMEKIMLMQADTMAWMLTQEKRRVDESMEPLRDPMRI